MTTLRNRLAVIFAATAATMGSGCSIVSSCVFPTECNRKPPPRIYIDNRSHQQVQSETEALFRKEGYEIVRLKSLAIYPSLGVTDTVYELGKDGKGFYGVAECRVARPCAFLYVNPMKDKAVP